jgi:anti-anti-sigma factor
MNPEVYRDGGCHVCRVTGVIDGQSGVFLHTAVRTSLQQTGEGRLVLECSGVENADSAGVRMLLQINKMMAGKGGMVLAAVSPTLRQSLELEGCEHLLETAVSLPAAVRNSPASTAPVTSTVAAGGGPSAVPGQPVMPPPSSWPETPHASSARDAARGADWGHPAAVTASSVHPPAFPPQTPPQPPAQDQGRSAAQPQQAQPRIPNLAPPLTSPAWSDGWDEQTTGNRKGGKAKKTGNKKAGSSSGFPWKIVLLAGLPVLLAIAGFSLWVMFRSPQIELSAATVEGDYGQNVGPIYVTVKYGKLSSASRKQLEEALGLEAVDNSENETDPSNSSLITYKIAGTLKGDSQVRKEFAIIAERDGRESRRTLTLSMKAPAFQFGRTDINLTEGEAISLEGERYINYLVAENADKLEAKWPAGLKAETLQDPKNKGNTLWVITGTPVKAGDFKVEMEAAVGGGTRTEKVFISVKEAPKPQPKEVPPAETASSTQASSEKDEAGSDAPAAVENPGAPLPPAARETFGEQPKLKGEVLNEDLTAFLFARIRESYFDQERKQLMAQAVGKMQVGLHLASVAFGTGAHQLDNTGRSKLLSSIAGNGDFFHGHPDHLEFIIVGYASIPGATGKNMALSWARAKAVEEFLRDCPETEKDGTKGGRISLTVGYGATSVVGNGTAGDNQVVEVYVGIPPKDDNLRNILADLRGYIRQIYGKR